MPSPVNYSNFLKRGHDKINNQSDDKQHSKVKQCTTFNQNGLPYHQFLHKLSLLSTKRVCEPNHERCLIYFTKEDRNKNFHVQKKKKRKEKNQHKNIFSLP